MRHYGPKEIIKNGKGSGLYHYCCSHGEDIYPVGYCSPWRSCPVCNDSGSFPLQDCRLCEGKGLVKVTDPCQGHLTKEDACNHYREYLLDRAKYAQEIEGKHECEICGELTSRIANIPGHILSYSLCAEHCNREGLDKVLKDIGESWAS
jgi:DnaJ-class molecular chaperone